jgi:hypothetical protein
MEKTAWWEATRFVLLARYYPGDQTKHKKIGGTCGTHERQERYIEGFGGETCRKETTWKT